VNSSPAGGIALLAPTSLEFAALKLLLPHRQIIRTGIGLDRFPLSTNLDAAIVCGLAGALRADYAPGTVVIPREVTTEGGPVLHCDPALVSALTTAARSLGFEPRQESLLTANRLVTGTERARWAGQGFWSADMETGLLHGRVARFAAIRVILDTPDHSIAEDWADGILAVFRPALWGELGWMAATGPRFALRAAQIARAALRRLDSQ
jgi:hypothetical protein